VDNDGRISESDKAELAILFKEHAADLYGQAKWRCNGDEELAKDLVMQTFEAATMKWREKLRCRTPGERKGWLHLTLRYKAVSAFRSGEAESRMRVRLYELDRLAEADVEDEAWEDLERAISRLPPMQRQITQLHWFDKMTGPEIAAALGIAENTVYSHLHAARKKLREELGPNYPYGSGEKGE
jgi:RNA polymerase sigma factor (sigma-70 family)